MKITIDNYEEWMVAYLDNELSKEEVLLFEKFMSVHPDLNNELEEYASLQLTSNDEIFFEDKEILLKKESAFILWRKMWPAAAAVLLAIAIIPFLRNNHTIEDNTIVKIVDSTKKTSRKQKVEAKKIESVGKTDDTEQVKVPEQIKPTKIEKEIVKRAVVKQSTLKNEDVVIKNVQEQIVQSKEALEVPLQEIIVQENKPRLKTKPKTYLPEKKEELENAFVKLPVFPTKELTANPALRGRLLTISAERTPLIHEKLSEVVMKIEDSINKIKTIKKTPITVCVGKRKLFTINN